MYTNYIELLVSIFPGTKFMNKSPGNQVSGARFVAGVGLEPTTFGL